MIRSTRVAEKRLPPGPAVGALLPRLLPPQPEQGGLVGPEYIRVIRRAHPDCGERERPGTSKHPRRSRTMQRRGDERLASGNERPVIGHERIRRDCWVIPSRRRMLPASTSPFRLERACSGCLGCRPPRRRTSWPLIGCRAGPPGRLTIWPALRRSRARRRWPGPTWEVDSTGQRNSRVRNREAR